MNLDIFQLLEAREKKTEVDLGSDAIQPPQPTSQPAHESASASTRKEWIWNPEDYAQEQLRGLVQRIFFSGTRRPVRQVVISAAETRTDVSGICRQVGEMLALETCANVVVVAGDLSGLPSGMEPLPDIPKRDPLATRVRGNLWLTPGLRGKHVRREMPSSSGWCARLCELRREFEYSIVEGPAGDSSDAAIAGQVADGMILVLAAHGTRRASVLWMQETLRSTKTHLLGTILADRRFPIPEGIYRRL